LLPARAASRFFRRNRPRKTQPLAGAQISSAFSTKIALFSGSFWCIYVTTAAERGFGLWGRWISVQPRNSQSYDG
jgi:hypothetical protein